MKTVDPALVIVALVAGILSVSLAAVAVRPPARCICEVRP